MIVERLEWAAPLTLAGLGLISGCGGAGVTGASITPPGEESGLTQRPSNATCLAGDAPGSSQSLAVQRVFTSLSFNSPVALLQAPASTARWFVVEQGGIVRAFANDVAAATSSVVLDISANVTSGGEAGLLGMAIHPDFPTDPRVFLSYTSGTNPLRSRISEFRSNDAGLTLDPSSEKILLTIDQPASNHNGGHLSFGPDGFLYAGFGDGGGGGDTWGAIGNGQNLQTLLGKLIRIDVSGSTGSIGYRIPADNPYSASALCATGNGTQSCPEIYAYGLRNPWRWNFDKVSGELWAADVGQDAWEEVDLVVRGGNYGWRCREGAHAYNADCGPAQSLIEPIAEYSRSEGQSITGGFVYRGAAIPDLVGRFVFGDFASGRIWSVARDTPPTLRMTGGFDSGLQIASFAQDASGELLIVNYAGTLHRLVVGTGTGSSIPAQLSATGCVDAGNASLPASGLVPYQPNAQFWSDNAQKSRFIGLPDGQKMSIGADQDWDVPVGSVLVKNFSLGSRRVETRLFMHHNDGTWAGYTYEWNDQGTDATRVTGGKSVTVAGQSWVFPSEAQCLSCHTQAAGRSLGLETAQLNGDLLYSQTQKTANQVVTLSAIGMLTPPVSADPTTLPTMPDPYGAAGSPGDRARAYLHTNCSQCHRPNGGTPSNMDLRYGTALAATNTCNALPQSGDLGILNAKLIAPGDAASSILVARADRRDAQAMPPVASAIVDAAGVTLLTEWVNGLSNCD